MVYSMQIKLKDESVLPFVDGVFAQYGYKKEVKPDGELIYSYHSGDGFAKMVGIVGELDNKSFANRCSKWYWIKDNNGQVEFEDCLKELGYNG